MGPRTESREICAAWTESSRGNNSIIRTGSIHCRNLPMVLIRLLRLRSPPNCLLHLLTLGKYTMKGSLINSLYLEITDIR
jgi:hypothetical protein